MRTPFLTDFAKNIGIWFTELDGRSIAVSEMEPFNDKSNVAGLPIAVVALITSNADAGNSTTTNNSRLTFQDDILLQFIFEPTKYKSKEGLDTPFFAFYNYEGIRDRLVIGLKSYNTPSGSALIYRSMEVESDEYAVYLSFRLRTSEVWCAPMDESDPRCNPPHPLQPVVSMTFGLSTPPGTCTQEVEEEVGPCPPTKEARDELN